MIRVEDVNCRPFRLEKRYMVQPCPASSLRYRRIRRTQLAKCLKRGSLAVNSEVEAGWVDGNWGDEPTQWAFHCWRVVNWSEHSQFPNELWIACVRFNAEAASRIRKWALTKPRKKVAARKKSLTASKKLAIKRRR